MFGPPVVAFVVVVDPVGNKENDAPGPDLDPVAWASTLGPVRLGGDVAGWGCAWAGMRLGGDATGWGCGWVGMRRVGMRLGGDAIRSLSDPSIL